MEPIIHQILRDKRTEIEARKKSRPLWRLRDQIATETPTRDFKGALLCEDFSVIAEIKRKSPSHGQLAPGLNVLELADLYEHAEGVSCISMLTDEKYFGCTIDDMRAVHDATTKPMLRKDFVLDEYQVYEARAYGADAVLLIATILEKEQLRHLASVVRSLGMEPFVESHTVKDLLKVPATVDVYGINTRDLMGKLGTDLQVVERLLPSVPSGKIVVGESGVETAAHMRKLYDFGVRASLTGAGIIRAQDRRVAIQELLSLVLIEPHPVNRSARRLPQESRRDLRSPLPSLA